jgi:L-ribulose-5-phosphate 3-epimerase UlaE
MIVSQIKINVSFKAGFDFVDADAEEVIEAIDIVDWQDIARQAIRGALYSEGGVSKLSGVNADSLVIEMDDSMF